jgi:hypothetical protein
MRGTETGTLHRCCSCVAATVGDGSTMFSAVSYYNAAISEFGTVVDAANV